MDERSPEWNLDGEQLLRQRLNAEIVRHINYFLERGLEDVYLVDEVIGEQGSVTRGATRFVSPGRVVTTAVFIELDPESNRATDFVMTSFNPNTPHEDPGSYLSVIQMAKLAELSHPERARRIEPDAFFTIQQGLDRKRFPMAFPAAT